MAGGLQGATPRGQALIEPFDYDGVRLLPGRMLDQVEHARGVYGQIPDDDILKGFRRRAGLPAPGRDMRGWCKDTSAGIFGQFLSGMARLGRVTGERALFDKANALLEGWHATLPENGNLGMQPYPREKLVCGLVDLHAYSGLTKALPILRQVTASFERSFDRTRRLADNYDFQGAGPALTRELYTLPENLYRAYLATGDRAFRDFAEVWLYEDYWLRFATTPAQPPANGMDRRSPL